MNSQLGKQALLRQLRALRLVCAALIFASLPASAAPPSSGAAPAPGWAMRGVHGARVPRAPLSRRGEGLMIVGGSLIAGGLTALSVSLTTEMLGLGDGYGDDTDWLSYFGSRLAVVGVAASLSGVVMSAVGYGQWSAGFRRWPHYYPGLEDPRGPPVRTNALHLIAPGITMIGAGGLLSGVAYLLSTEEAVLVPGLVAGSIGAALVTSGIIRAHRARLHARVHLAPSVARTRRGSWTGGLVMRW